MANVLDEILANKRAEVQRAKAATPVDVLRGSTGYAAARRNFFGAVAVPRRERPNLIAEIKHRSPSAGVIRADFNAVAIAGEYERAGAAALSVLTDEKYFGGRADFIAAVKNAVGLPVLRKDFIVDEYQVHESRAIGADAILLIAEALDGATLGALARAALDAGLCVLLEVHSRERLLDALNVVPVTIGHLLLGINNRNLATQTVDLATFEGLATFTPPNVPLVAESGIRTRGDVLRMHKAGARAILVGESLLKQADIGAAVRELSG